MVPANRCRRVWGRALQPTAERRSPRRAFCFPLFSPVPARPANLQAALLHGLLCNPQGVFP